MSPRFQRCDQKRDCHKPPSPRHGLASLHGSGSAPCAHPTPRAHGPQLTPRSVPGPELSPRPGPPPPRHGVVAQLMRRLQDRDWASRKAAVESLGSLVTGDARVLDGVMQHLESRSERARQTAVWTLSRIVGRGNRGAVDRLLDRIAHPLLEVRMAAVTALGQVRPPPQPARTRPPRERSARVDGPECLFLCWSILTGGVDQTGLPGAASPSFLQRKRCGTPRHAGTAASGIEAAASIPGAATLRPCAPAPLRPCAACV